MATANKKVIDLIVSTDPKTKRWKSLMSAARLAYASGELRQAESLLTRAHELADQLPEKNFALHASDIALAAVTLAKGEAKNAKRRFERIISNLESASDPLQKELLAVAQRFYADALIELGEERSAEKELLKSSAILQALGVKASVQLSYTLCDLCSLYLMQGRHSEASVQINGAIEILMAAVGFEDPLYVSADMIYAISMPMPESERCDTASCGIQKLIYVYGEKHPNIARALKRYATVLQERGDTARLEATREKFDFLSKGRRF